MPRLTGTIRLRRLPSSQAEQGLRPFQKTATRGPHAHAIDHPHHPLRTRRRRRGRPPAGGCSGWTTGADGRAKTFAFLVNGKTSSTTLKQNVDMLAATVNGCY